MVRAHISTPGAKAATVATARLVSPSILRTRSLGPTHVTVGLETISRGASK
jgi:hypothetical protein